MKYYLINNKIMKASSDMPNKPCYKVIWDEDGDEIWNDWKSSLQQCEISESELLKLNKHLYYANKDKQGYKFKEWLKSESIDVTGLIENVIENDESGICFDTLYFKPISTPED